MVGYRAAVIVDNFCKGRPMQKYRQSGKQSKGKPGS
jgi:hypothetical protein